MGFIDNVAKRINRILANSPEKEAEELSKGLVIGPRAALTGGMLGDMGYKSLSDLLRVDTDVLSRYMDYEEMDAYPILTQSLNIYADEATQIDADKNTAMWVVCDDNNLKIIIDHLLHNTLDVDNHLWDMTRTLCKYGSDFSEIIISENGVIALKYLPPATMRRIEDQYGNLKGFIQTFNPSFGYTLVHYEHLMALKKAGKEQKDPKGGDLATNAMPVVAFEPWEIIQLRLKGKYRNSMYGTSVLEPARWIYKRLNLLEDSAILYRLQRSPERLAFFVETGNAPAEEAFALVNKVKMGVKKRKFIDPRTGKLNLTWEPFGVDEDYWIPSKNGVETTRIQQIASPQWSSMDDIEYFKNNLFASIGIPKAYLAQDEGVARAVLSSEDVRFARSILRIQQAVKEGFTDIVDTHLAALGINAYKQDFKLYMTVPSSIFELAQLEVKNARADYAARVGAYVSTEYILKNILGFSDEEIEALRDQQMEDAERNAEIMKTTGVAPGNTAPTPAPVTPTPPTTPPTQNPAPASSNASPDTTSAAAESLNRRVATLRSKYGQEPLLENKQMSYQTERKLDQLLMQDKESLKKLSEIRGLLRDIIITRGTK